MRQGRQSEWESSQNYFRNFLNGKQWWLAPWWTDIALQLFCHKQGCAYASWITIGSWILTISNRFSPHSQNQKILRRGGKNTQKNYTKKKKEEELHDPDNHDAVITHLEPDILECKVKWALGSITKNKASGGDGIPVELFQIVKDDAVKVLDSICQKIWKN